jgi:hypothetical protein
MDGGEIPSPAGRQDVPDENMRTRMFAARENAARAPRFGVSAGKQTAMLFFLNAAGSRPSDDANRSLSLLNGVMEGLESTAVLPDKVTVPICQRRMSVDGNVLQITVPLASEAGHHQ